jgi:hypothetical protein
MGSERYVPGGLDLGSLKIAGTAVTSTAAELNILDGVTSTAAELNILDGVTSTAAELNILDGVTSTAAELNTLDAALAGATFTVGAEDTNVITVNIQLVDAAGVALAHLANVFAYLSDDSTGIAISGQAPATSVAAGTDGAIIVEHTSKLAWTLQSEADGDIDLVITETGTYTWYLVIVLPNGNLAVSGAITFAA